MKTPIIAILVYLHNTKRTRSRCPLSHESVRFQIQQTVFSQKRVKVSKLWIENFRKFWQSRDLMFPVSWLIFDEESDVLVEIRIFKLFRIPRNKVWIEPLLKQVHLSQYDIVINVIWMSDLIIKNRSFYSITRLQSHCRRAIKKCFFKCGKLRLKFHIDNQNVTLKILDENSWHNFRIGSWINLRQDDRSASLNIIKCVFLEKYNYFWMNLSIRNALCE